MKKKHIFYAVLWLCAVPWLYAQTPCLPQATTIGGIGHAVTNCPNPTPTPFPTPTPTPSPTPAVEGAIGPKFIVVAVTYAPPGSLSTVSYLNSTMLGNSVSVSNSFTSDTSISSSITTGFNIFGFGVSDTSIASTGLTQETDSSSSIAVNVTATTGFTVPGPASSAVGLDHDQDIIWVWLNPILHLVVNSDTSFTWTGFGFDLNDPAGDTDIIGIPVKFLNGHAPIPTNVADVLARRWAPRVVCSITTDPTCGADGTDDPGLNASDLAAILATDPFSDPTYVINLPAGSPCTADGRFCRTSNQNLQYSPPAPGGQPITETLSLAHQTTATQGQGASTTYKIGFSNQFSASAGFFASIMAKLSIADMLSWTSKWSSTSTQQVGQTATASVTGPSTADNYTGPVEFNVFQDNIYGSFMFGFIPEPTFTLGVSPALQSVNQGSCTSYTVSTGALVTGFGATVNLAVAAGLPASATASFNPTTISGAGTSTLTVCAASTTPIGATTLTINANAGIEVHSATASLTVNTPPPPPNFTLAVSPSAQSVVAGSSASYTVSTAAISGFAGTESLTVSGVPAGVTVTFSPASIPTGGSSTMAVSTASTAAAGTYTLVVTATSGALSHTANATLTVSAPAPPPPPPPPPPPCTGRNCLPQG